MYRKAKCVELYDAHTALATLAYTDYYLIGRTDDGPRPAYKIPVFDILALLSAINVEVNHDHTEAWPELTHTHQSWADPPLKQREEYKLNIENFEINVLDYIDSIVDTSLVKITELEIEVLSANLLNIRVKSIYFQDEEITTEITYSGRFQIWW